MELSYKLVGIKNLVKVVILTRHWYMLDLLLIIIMTHKFYILIILTYISRDVGESGMSMKVKAITEVTMLRRSDGQPVRVKKKVKVDVDGNLDVAEILDVHKITALTSNNRANGLTVTSEGYVGIGTSNPSYPLHVTSMNVAAYLEQQHAYLNVASNVGVATGSQHQRTMSAWFNGHIAAEEFFAMSDSRIKNDIYSVVDDCALQQG